jgi:hypothetical protein
MCIGLFCAGRIGVLGALELEVSAGINNFSFDFEKKAIIPLNDDSKSDASKPCLFPYFGNISFRDDISNIMSYSINFERDRIMMNRLYATFSAKTDYVSVEFGPFFGLYDDFKKFPDIGIIGTIEFSLPGVGFLSVGGSSTLGSKFDFLSGNIHESAEAKFGLYLPPFLIVSASAVTKSYKVIFKEGDSDLTRCDSLIRYQASADFYGKNFPFRLRIDGGLQTFSIDNESNKLELKSYFVGLEMNIQASQSWRIILGAEMPLFPEAKEPTKVSDEFLHLFKARAGFVYTFH